MRWILDDELRRLCAAGEPGEARKLVEEAIRRDFMPDSYLLERRLDIMKLQGDSDGLIKGYYDFFDDKAVLPEVLPQAEIYAKW